MFKYKRLPLAANFLLVHGKIIAIYYIVGSIIYPLMLFYYFVPRCVVLKVHSRNSKFRLLRTQEGYFLPAGSHIPLTGENLRETFEGTLGC